ncbi:cation diffusion facilitator family transporter [Histidinibacterium aquaticum]|uniref:Cation transporter n=1 Tax=Histidinibacterium aquaticum TaxID=2613962 RepID=A0A5J5GFL1_9RHOB|nr:cation diffusion facilitator family transporter [Histidinibacterium aquaticum]KAA9006867.1 cation transporter [Histidinibacterium aquaticum]
MPHDHHHHHVPQGDGKLVAAVGVNLFLTVAQVVGGVISGSLALIADALHNLSDALALVIALVARKIARRPADAEMTFGYARAETVAALVNYTTLIVLALYLVYEALMGVISPEPVAGWIMVIVAGIALAVDLATAALTYAMSKTSQNIRAAFLHNLADALGSVAVIVAGSLILLFGWTIVDPIVTFAIAGYILWMSIAEIGGVIRILMLGAPDTIDTGNVVRDIAAVEGVDSVHHAHLWQMEEHRPALEAHVVIAAGRWGEADAIKGRVKDALQRVGIDHSTLELECSNHACTDPKVIGHRVSG